MRAFLEPLGLGQFAPHFENQMLGMPILRALSAEELRFANIGQAIDDTWLDLVVTATTPYDPWNIASTRVNGQFGQINLRADRAVGLRFCFVAQQPSSPTVVLDKFYFSFYDFDSARASGMREQLVASGPQVTRPNQSSSPSLAKPLIPRVLAGSNQ